MDGQLILNSSSALLIGAFLLDLAVGDPHWLPHPVVLMGKVISCGERLLLSGHHRCDLLAGAALSLLVIALSAGTAWALVISFHKLPFWLSFVAIVALASTTVATSGLLEAVKQIEAPLRAGKLVEARESLSHIVGRETADLNQDKVL